jgi:hypothetical protein
MGIERIVTALACVRIDACRESILTMKVPPELTGVL